MFLPVKIIEYQQDCRGHPRHGIADEYRRQFVPPGNDQQDPRKAHTANAAQCDQGREQYVADSAQRPGKDLDEYENNIAGSNITQHIDSDVHHI